MTMSDPDLPLGPPLDPVPVDDQIATRDLVSPLTAHLLF